MKSKYSNVTSSYRHFWFTDFTVASSSESNHLTHKQWYFILFLVMQRVGSISATFWQKGRIAATIRHLGCLHSSCHLIAVLKARRYSPFYKFVIKYMPPVSSPISSKMFGTCLPRCGGEGSGLYGGAGGGRDLHSVEFWCHRGIHNGAVRMTGSPWGL